MLKERKELFIGKAFNNIKKYVITFSSLNNQYNKDRITINTKVI